MEWWQSAASSGVAPVTRVGIVRTIAQRVGKYAQLWGLV